jgi:uncharacterized protein with HEPN domain
MQRDLDRLERVSSDATRDRYLADEDLQDIVERRLERLSEAVRRLPDDMTAIRPEIPWRRIADLGNVLRHAYDRVDQTRLWEIIVKDLPPLRQAIDALLHGYDRTG